MCQGPDNGFRTPDPKVKHGTAKARHPPLLFWAQCKPRPAGQGRDARGAPSSAPARDGPPVLPGGVVENQAASGTTAVTSISTLARASISADTSTQVMAGKWRPITSR